MKKVLIIEDDPEITNLLKIHLIDLDCDVTKAFDGRTGLNLALGNSFDLIILDIMLPELDGFEVCKELRKREKHTPILMLTSKSEEMDKVLGLEFGADDYMNKPFDERVLILKVNNLIASRAHLRNKYSKEITLKPKDITITSADEKFLDNFK